MATTGSLRRRPDRADESPLRFTHERRTSSTWSRRRSACDADLGQHVVVRHRDEDRRRERDHADSFDAVGASDRPERRLHVADGVAGVDQRLSESDHEVERCVVAGASRPRRLRAGRRPRQRPGCPESLSRRPALPVGRRRASTNEAAATPTRTSTASTIEPTGMFEFRTLAVVPGRSSSPSPMSPSPRRRCHRSLAQPRHGRGRPRRHRGHGVRNVLGRLWNAGDRAGWSGARRSNGDRSGVAATARTAPAGVDNASAHSTATITAAGRSMVDDRTDRAGALASARRADGGSDRR